MQPEPDDNLRTDSTFISILKLIVRRMIGANAVIVVLASYFQVDNMKLTYNATTRISQDAPGVEIRIPGWGNPSVVEWIDPSEASAGAYFNSIATELIALGYARNVTLLGAPYDFRRGPRKFS